MKPNNLITHAKIHTASKIGIDPSYGPRLTDVHSLIRGHIVNYTHDKIERSINARRQEFTASLHDESDCWAGDKHAHDATDYNIQGLDLRVLEGLADSYAAHYVRYAVKEDSIMPFEPLSRETIQRKRTVKEIKDMSADEMHIEPLRLAAKNLVGYIASRRVPDAAKLHHVPFDKEHEMDVAVKIVNDFGSQLNGVLQRLHKAGRLKAPDAELSR